MKDKKLIWLAVAPAAICLAGLYSSELSDTDAWWHLATGEFIAHHHRLPDPDPFAYTTAMTPPASPDDATLRRFNLTHEWLAQLAMYLIASAAGGLWAVVLAKGLLLAATGALAGWVAVWRTGSFWWGIASAFAGAPVIVLFAHDRPAVISWFFVAVFVALFEQRRLLWLLPLAALIWANCHGGFFLGWIVVAAYAVNAIWRRSEDRTRVLGYGAAAVLISGVNPNGFGVVTILSQYRKSPMTAALMEWSHPGWWSEPYAFFILLYGAALVLLLAWRRVRISDWLLFAAFAGASLAAFRNEPLTAWLAPILIATYFPWRPKLPQPKIASYAACAVLGGAAIWGIADGRLFQLRAAEWKFPVGAASFLEAHMPGARIFNSWEDGGHLIWRGLSVFIDGRALSENVFQDYRMIMGTEPGDTRRSAALAHYGVNAIVINAFEYNSGIIYPLVRALAAPAESQWKLVYEDPAAMVFMRDPAEGVAALDKSRIVDHLERECEMHVTRGPEFSLCARNLASLFLRQGDRRRARRNLELYVAHPYADDPEARQMLQKLRQEP